MFIGVNFVRDDERLLEDDSLPDILQDLSLLTITSTDDALEVAAALRHNFTDTDPLMQFAKWLEDMAPHCSKFALGM